VSTLKIKMAYIAVSMCIYIIKRGCKLISAKSGKNTSNGDGALEVFEGRAILWSFTNCSGSSVGAPKSQSDAICGFLR
jgi:hypothetical protein